METVPMVEAAPPATDFETLLESVLERAYHAALHFTRNRADAEDLVQETVLNAWRGFKSFEPGTNFKAWFFRIMTNSFRSSRRKKRPEDDAAAYEEVSDLYLFRHSREAGMDISRYDPAASALARLDSAQVARALQALPDEFRMVATLYFVEDFRYEDIAEIIGVPVGTVRSRLHRARRLLQKRLWQLAQDYGLTDSIKRKT